MASEPIDTSTRPSFRSTVCGGGCGEHIVVDVGFLTGGGTPYCSKCARDRLGGATPIPAQATPPKPGHPAPPDPVYPPSVGQSYAVRVSDPNVNGRCLDHPMNDPAGDLHLMTTEPDDITIGFGVHDYMHHNTSGGPWLIAGDSGLTGDVCDPCGGGVYDKTIGKSVPLQGGPRHDLCYAGRTRGRGNDCPCTHDKTWMRGVKPGTRDTPGAVQRLRADLEQRRADAASNPPIPPPTQGYLFDPEEENDHDIED